MTMALDELINLPDDLDIDVASPDSYNDQMSSPLPKGKYRFRINEWRFAKKKDGTLISPTKPVVELVELEVVEGQHTGRKLMFQRVFTTTYDRGGVQVSGFGDLVRAIDCSANWQGKEGFQVLQAAQDQGKTFVASVDWEALDQSHMDKLLAGREIKDLPKDEQKSIRKEATVRGMSKFDKLPDGSYKPVVKHRSGETLEARAVITGFTRSDLA